MANFRAIALIVAGFLTCCGHPQAPQAPKDAQILESFAYFPMEIGHKWTYGAKEGPDVVFEVVGKESVNGIECFKTLRTVADEVTPFYVSLSRQGLMIHRVANEDYHPPFLEFAFPITEPEAAGRTWSGMIGERMYEIRTRNTGSETVALPSGPVDAISVSERMEHGRRVEGEDKTVIDASLSTHFWIVRDFGVVKLIGKERDPHNPSNREFDWTLKSFRRTR